MTAWRFLFISLAVHLVVWYFLLNRPSIKFPFQDKDKTEITIVDKNKKPRPLTRSTQLPPDMLKKTPPKDPKYLSDKDQSVTKEMRAKNLGMTQNQLRPGMGKGNGSQPQKKPQGHPKEDQGETPKRLDLNAISPNFNDQPMVPPTNPGGGVSTSEDDRSITEGPITALNSERFLYASFFNRIEDRMRPIWERNLSNAHDGLPPKKQHDMNNHEWVTIVDVALDPQGHYLTTTILQSSGIPEIDQAGVNAFREASYFPNPPHELVKADNKIHLQMSLHFLVGDNGFGPWSRRF